MEGHEGLALLPLARNSQPTPHFVLRCVECGTEWRRDFGADSAVRWLRTAASSGERGDLDRNN